MSREGGRRQGLRSGCPPSPPLYIGAGERGEAQPCPFLQGRGAANGGRSASQVKWRPSPLGFPLSHAHGPCGAGAPGPLRLGRPLTAHAAVLDVVEQFPDLRTPPESSGTFWKLPGTIPKKPELFPEPEQQLSIYKSLPPDHSGTPRDVRISSGTPNNFRFTAYSYLYNPSVTEP